VRTIIAVGRRPDGGRRDELWGYTSQWWAQFGWPIVEGQHLAAEAEGFSVAAARNRAVAAAGDDWDVAVVIDSDVVCENPAQVRRAVQSASRTGRLTFAQTWWAGLSQAGTHALMGGERYERGMVEQRNPWNHSCTYTVRRDLWEQVRGFDERFQGWGFEDIAFAAACQAVAGRVDRIPGDVLHLWHERRVEEKEGNPWYGQNWQLETRYTEAKHSRVDMLALIARRGEPWWHCGRCAQSMTMGPVCETCGKEPA